MDYSARITEALYEAFPHQPTSGQEDAIRALALFLSNQNAQSLFLLKGYAGTGKTTLVSTLVKVLKRFRVATVLLAPTGRAAKVLGAYSGRRAHTIHKSIYAQRVQADGSVSLELARNNIKRCLFIVDEASMITDERSNSGHFQGREVLSDLISFVYSGERCRLLLLGDTAQLPPVGLELSPALDASFLRASYHLKIYEAELRDVVRQEMGSAVLRNATALREMLRNESYAFPWLKLPVRGNIQVLDAYGFQEALMQHFSGNDAGESILITRTNTRANLFNREIRQRILFREGEINAGDRIMVVRNNYFWLDADAPAGFIANGDMLELLRIEDVEDKHGLRFAMADCRMLDYPEQATLSALILLDTLDAPGPGLGAEDQENFFRGVMEEYRHIENRRARLEAVRNDPYYNALHIKFAYALTCHKTQGGQWENVFIDQGYLSDEMVGRSYLRWLYTALTRASGRVYLIGFREEMIAEEGASDQ